MTLLFIAVLFLPYVFRAFLERDDNVQASVPSLVVPTVVALFVWFVFGSLAVRSLVSVLQGDLEAAPWLLISCLLLFPFQIARAALVPLGLVRLSYYLTLLCSLRFFPDRRGGALIAASLALLQQRSPGRRARAFIEARLTKLEQLRGASVVVAGLLAAERGDADGARALLTAISTIDRHRLPVQAVEIARTWLCADAAAGGDWLRVARFGRIPGPTTAEIQFLSACARRFVVLPPPAGNADPAAYQAPSAARLRRLWLRAPRRLQTRPLLERALASTPRAPVAAPPPPATAPETDATLDGALAALARLTAEPAGPDELPRLLRTARAWDRALQDEAPRRRLRERALLLGSPPGTDPEQALRTLRTQVTELLGERVRAAGLRLSDVTAPPPPLGAASPLLTEASRSVRDELLADLEQRCDAVRRRVEDKRALPMLDEWREWADLRARYEHVCRAGGQEVQRLAWPKWNRDICSLAVWLWNERGVKERSLKTLANAIFRSLLVEAEALDDERTADLQRKNVGCGAG